MFSSIVTKIPYSITIHSAGEKELCEFNAIAKKLENAKFIRAIASYILEDLSSFINDKVNIHVIRCGININASNKIKAKANQILAVGRLVEKKGFLYLIKAINNLSSQGVKCHLRIIGDGPLYNDLLAEIRHSNIELLKSRSNQEVLDYITSSSLLVVPSVTALNGEKEGLPTVIMESMLLGTTVIATRHSGIPEVVINNETGMLVPEKNIEALSETIKLILSEPKLSKSLSEKALVLVRNEFDIDKTTKELIELWT